MDNINKALKKYIENDIFPIYNLNEKAHGIEHIKYVIERSLKFAEQFKNINLDIVYTIAAFHDIGHHIDKDNHEVISANIFYNNPRMKNFFTDEERLIIKEAIEDHRSTLKYEPRSDYGKIVSSADRTSSIDSILMRTHSYGKTHYKDLNIYQLANRAYNHAIEKYGNNGYAKSYCYDEDYEKFKVDLDNLLKDKWAFVKRYLEVNELNNIVDKATIFALIAHEGQVRKSEPDKPMIMHPINVGEILKKYGYSEEVQAAGILHDVVEDTKYTIDDIKDNFGEYIASLVMGASEPDKSLSWEERKKHTINTAKTLHLENKLVICADKISNLEDLLNLFKKNGNRDFSAFKRGEKEQKWYYESIYESLIAGEDKNLPIFKHLKNILDTIFENKENDFLKNTIFTNNQEYYQKLQQLHYAKLEIAKIKEISTSDKPFVVEFSGTPRTGKTTTINNLYDFFKKGGFNVQLIEEFTTSKFFKEKLKSEFKDLSVGERNIAIIECVYQQLIEAINENKDIILIDRSINDRQIWNYRRYLMGEIDEEKYIKVRDKYSELSKQLIDFLIITYADSLTSLKRDYLSSLALEERNFLNQSNIEDFNNSLTNLKDLFNQSVNKVLTLDTSNMEINDVAIKITEEILPSLRTKYIEDFKKTYCIKK